MIFRIYIRAGAGGESLAEAGKKEGRKGNENAFDQQEGSRLPPKIRGRETITHRYERGAVTP